MDLRSFKDFMILYNETTERCFNKCVNNFNERKLDHDELRCAESCAGKHISFFNRVLSCYLDSQQDIMVKRMAEAEQSAQQMAQAEQAAQQLAQQATPN